MQSLPEETWKPVPSMHGIEASSHGRVRRLPHTVTTTTGRQRIYSSQPRFGAICSSSSDARHLYFLVQYKRLGGGGVLNIKVHYAVCEAFHGVAPEGKRRVRHLNENGLDNRPENLVWDTQRVNQNDPLVSRYRYRRVSPKAKTNLSKAQKRAGIYDSIRDIGYFQRSLREMRAANDNHKAAEAA